MRYERPKCPSEARVVFELCHRLRNEGIDFDLEYKVSHPGTNKHVSFDVVILRDRHILGIVEAKRSRKYVTSKEYSVSFQVQKYKTISGGVPTMCFYGFEEIDLAVQFSKDCLT